MTATTNVPPIVWVNGAPVLPQESDIKTGVFTDINNAFGGGLNPADNTPQGQLTASETAIIGDKNSQIAYIANQVNPVYATGQWQDAIGQIYFINRIAAAGTVVNCTCVGAVNTVIPLGATVQDTSGYIYASTAAATIPASGSVSVQFQNQTLGAIPCTSGAINKIYSAISGWDSVTNISAGVLGNAVESKTAFEARRKASVALNSINSTQAIRGQVLSIPNVVQCVVMDNYTNSPITVGSTNYTMVGNSVLVSVSGGNSQAIAQAIWQKKSLGCSYNGNTTVNAYDTTYSVPYPTYPVTFLIPTSTPAYFNVQIKNDPQLPSGIISSVQNAIIAAFNGTDGGSPAYINSTIYSTRFYTGIAALGANVEIINFGMGFSAPLAINISLSFGVDQVPVISANQIVVTLV